MEPLEDQSVRRPEVRETEGGSRERKWEGEGGKPKEHPKCKNGMKNYRIM